MGYLYAVSIFSLDRLTVGACISFEMSDFVKRVDLKALTKLY